MSKHFLSYFLIAVILVLRTRQGFAFSITQLYPPHLEDTVRLVKSHEMFKYMNLSADPCENFYEYTCGNYAKYNPLSKDDVDIGNFEKITSRMSRNIQIELENFSEAETEADKNVKRFYRSCLQVKDSWSYFYPEKLKEVLLEFDVEMPVLTEFEWQEHSFDWSLTLAQMIYLAEEGSLLDVGLLPDPNDPKMQSLFIVPSGLSVDDNAFYTSSVFEKERQKLLDKIYYDLRNYLNIERDLAQETAREMFELEVALAELYPDYQHDNQASDQFTRIAIDELQNQYPHVMDFSSFLNEALGDISDHSHVYVLSSYLERLPQVLERFPKKVVANYLFYRYLSRFFSTTAQTTADLESYCLRKTTEYFYENIDNMIYRKYFGDEAESVLFALWRKLKVAFRDILFSPNVDWLHEDTRMEAIAKLRNMKLRILSYANSKFIDEVERLQLDEGDYIYNVQSILALNAKLAREELSNPQQKRFNTAAESSLTPANVLNENIVLVPISTLQPYLMWSTEYPSFINFASLGFFIAHEITHGFDDTGRHYDDKGNDRSWWDPHTHRQFRERHECFVNQYKNYMYGGRRMPENADQSENISDAGGLHLAFEAYLNWYQNAVARGDSLEKESLPDFVQFDHKQMFFISNAHIWCSNYADSVAAELMADGYAPAELRAIGPMVNFDEFSKAFNCPIGTAMYPVKKCVIY